MKRIVYLFLLSILLVSCGERNGYFKIDGRLLHVNQGQLFVYSPEGVMNGLDTIQIKGGRFTYEVPCQFDGTLILIFPNYSTHVIFAEPGEAVEIKADASHLKEMEVKGTDNNELMGQFRKQTAMASPPEEVKLATQFVKNHPDSPVSIYITERYLVSNKRANLKETTELVKLMEKEQPENGALARLKQYLQGLQNGNVGQPLPKFTAKDLNGNIINSAKLKGKNTIICSWASWNDDSRDILMTLNSIAQKDSTTIIGICLDPSPNEARRYIKENNIIFPNICDGEMLESKLIKTLGLTLIPDNIIANKGKITERRVSANMLRGRMIKLEI